VSPGSSFKPIQTVTLKTQQILTGETKGAPATLAGELRIPKPGSDRLPVVVLIHGSGGVGGNVDAWAKEINSLGVAAFILDTFSGRGIVSTVSDQSQLDSLAMVIDAYRALSMLAQHPRIDPARIAVMGFSKGAVPAVYSSNERFRKLYNPAKVSFAAHIGLYTPCNVQYRDDDKVTGRRSASSTALPTTMSRSPHAAAMSSASNARALTSRSPNIPMPTTPTTVRHSLSAFRIPRRKRPATALCGRATMAKYSTPRQAQSIPLPIHASSTAHVGFNQAAYQATVKAVREFLAATFKLSS